MNRDDKKQLIRLLVEKKRRAELHKSSGRFWSFCLYYDYEFFTSRPFLEETADALQYVYDEYVAGRPRRVSVSMPPRSGKSYIISLFCAWWLGKLPTLSVMRNACTATLYRKFSYDVRNIIRSKKWSNIFQGISLSPDKSNLDGWNLTTAKQVSYFGNGVGGTIIGFGANLAITDDLYKDIEAALSPDYNEKVLQWKESAHDSRKELNCPEIFIGTRWSKQDIIGRAIESKKIDRQMKISALTPDRKSFCEAVKSTAEYLEIEADIDPTIWEAEYQQEPIENKGSLYPMSELKFFEMEEFNAAKPEYCFIPVDPADSGGDFYAAPKSYLIGKYVYITDIIFNNHGTDINIPATTDMAISSKANYVQVEGNSGWVLAGKDIRNEINDKLPECEVRIIKAITNKETRILTFSSWVRNYVRFRSDYKDDRQYAAFMKNLTGYLREGKNAHDDAPDVMAQLAEYFKKNFSHLW
jgi:predicted phage terminase large subunit-like protein